MFGINDQYFMDMQIAGKQIPVNHTTVQTMSVIQNALIHVPTLEVTFLDVDGRLAKTPVSDGEQVEIMFGHSLRMDNVEPINFRMFGPPSLRPVEGGSLVSFKAMLDAPKYLRGMVDKSYKGTASDVIKQVAGEVGLTADVHSTQDKQVWLPQRKPFSSWIAHVVDHAYAGAQSAMVHGVTETKKLLFKDLSKLANEPGKKKLVYGNYKPGQIMVLDYEVVPKAGVMNNWIGYGSRTVQQGLDGVIKDLDKVDVTRLSSSLEMSSAVKNLVGAVRSEFSPLNAGNVHEKFFDAFHQNRRIKSTFSLDIHVLTPQFTDLHLYDTCDLELMDPSSRTPNSNYSGTYIVTGKVRYIQGTRYWEKLTLTSQGKNGSVEGMV